MALEIRRDRVYQIWAKARFQRIDNVLVLGGEAHAIFRDFIAAGSLTEVFINYPDPPVWPGSSWRLVTRDFLISAHRALRRGGGSSLTLVTDDPGYAASMVKDLAKLPHLFASAFGPDTPYQESIPEEYGVSSYFDRMWRNGGRAGRYYLRYVALECDDATAAAGAAESALEAGSQAAAAPAKRRAPSPDGEAAADAAEEAAAAAVAEEEEAAERSKRRREKKKAKQEKRGTHA